MPAIFDDVFKVIKAHEVGPSKNGGLVDHPADPGGLTKWGVSYRFIKNILPLVQSFGVTFSFPVPTEELAIRTFIRDLTEEQAREFYLKCWWDFFKLYLIEDAMVATKICDMAINMGPPNGQSAARGRAFEIVQRGLQRAGKFCHESGLLGPFEITLINEAEPTMLLTAICKEQALFYQSIVTKNPSQAVFLKGWLSRARWPYKTDP